MATPGPGVQREAMFWLQMLEHMPTMPIADVQVPAALVTVAAADTSDTASGGFVVNPGAERPLLFRQLLNADCRRLHKSSRR